MGWYNQTVGFVKTETEYPPRNKEEFIDIFRRLNNEYERLHSLAADYKKSLSNDYPDISAARDFVYNARIQWDDMYGSKF